MALPTDAMNRQTPSRSYWADRAILAVLIAVSAWLPLMLERGPGELAAIWVSNGLLAGWLLSRRTSTWPGYLLTAVLAAMPARMLAGDGALYAAAIAGCDLVEVLGVALVVRRAVPDMRSPRSWMRLGGIATASTLVSCAVAGVLAASVAWMLYQQPFLPELQRWYTAHVVGMVVVGTMTRVALRERLRLFFAPGRRWSLVATLGLLGVVTAAVFATSHAVLFLAYPPLLLVAVRHRFAGVAMGVIVLALVAATATTMGHGPFASHAMEADQRIALLQLYIAGACVMAIPICLAMAERDRYAASMRESERRYRMLADHSHDMIVRIDADENCIYVSPSASDELGWPVSEMLGDSWIVVHPDDAEVQRQTMREVLASGITRTLTCRLLRRDGSHIWVESVSRRIPADDGSDRHDVMFVARNIDRRMAAEQALEESLHQLERQSRVDALTGVANRREFDERFDRALRRLHRASSPLALLCIDIDRFKAINDGHGHAAGDVVLKQFAARLQACVRDTDLVARIGGDEFAILLENVESEGAEGVAGKVVEAMGAPFHVGATQLQVTTSIGIACTRRPVDPASLMARADAALYTAKGAGRNRYQVAPD